jgi:gamma-glutamylcyclotransferase (GGCT)/AIG2-like uncharacterized protein YtfP
MTPTPDATTNCNLLFAYGTLRRGFNLHHHLVRLGAKYFGMGKLAGELFALGFYPGARPSTRKGKWIRGEVYQLGRPEQDLRALDEVEGFTPQVPERGEFVRKMTGVVVEGRGTRCAWVYWLNRSVPQGQRVASGDYLQCGEGGKSRGQP